MAPRRGDRRPLPFIVAATQIGVITGRIPAETATALVCAGLVSVLVFPALAVLVVGRTSPRPGVAASG